MNILIKYGLVILLSLGISSISLAISIVDVDINGDTTALNDTEVGGLDIWKGETNSLVNSKPSTEEAWLRSILTLSANAIFTVGKEETVAYYETNEDNTFATELSSATSDYWILKNAGWWVLYENVAFLNWGVFDASSLQDGMNIPDKDGEFLISHVTVFDGESGGGGGGGGGSGGEIPEPSGIALIGLGLIAFSFVQRKYAVTSFKA